MKTGMKKTVSCEDFLVQLSDIRFNLEADRYVLGAVSLKKLYPPASERSKSKSPKKHAGEKGSGVLFDSRDSIEKVLDRVQTKKNSAYG